MAGVVSKKMGTQGRDSCIAGEHRQRSLRSDCHDVPTQFKDFDDYWLPFLAAQGSVSKYLGAINDETRSALRDQLQRQLPTAYDGSISLVARAWAVKGEK
jgi:hypothetical protein